MSNYDRNDPRLKATLEEWFRVTKELTELEGKTDPRSRERYDALIDDLLFLDGCLKPMKDAMKRASIERQEVIQHTEGDRVD